MRSNINSTVHFGHEICSTQHENWHNGAHKSALVTTKSFLKLVSSVQENIWLWNYAFRRAWRKCCCMFMFPQADFLRTSSNRAPSQLFHTHFQHHESPYFDNYTDFLGLNNDSVRTWQIAQTTTKSHGSVKAFKKSHANFFSPTWVPSSS